MKPETGRITSWNDAKGFGFILPDSGGKSIFIHIRDFSKHHKRPVRGLSVYYHRATDSRGRQCAVRVCPATGHRYLTRADRQLLSSEILVGVFFVIVGGLAAVGWLPFIVPAIYALFSVLAFLLYGVDKSAARSGRRRIPESTLHLISLCGGWPGAIVSQYKLRHKSRKLSFRAVYWATVIFNCGCLGYLLTPDGAMRLKVLLAQLHFG